MITNKIIDILLTITAWVVVPLQLITTFVLGILVTLTFGLLLLPFSLLWMVLFLGPLLGLSYIWERILLARPLVSILGIPLAVVADAYVCLLPSMGEMDSRAAKLLLCQTFPYTWRFNQISLRKSNVDSDDELNIILKRISKDIGLRQYLKVFLEQNTIDKS